MVKNRDKKFKPIGAEISVSYCLSGAQYPRSNRPNGSLLYPPPSKRYHASDRHIVTGHEISKSFAQMSQMTFSAGEKKFTKPSHKSCHYSSDREREFANFRFCGKDLKIARGYYRAIGASFHTKQHALTTTHWPGGDRDYKEAQRKRRQGRLTDSGRRCLSWWQWRLQMVNPISKKREKGN